jgi:hypothetical protein
MSVSRRPVLACAAIPLLCGAGAAAAADVVRGSGIAATARRDLSGFVAVALGGPWKVVVRPAARDGVTVAADDNVLPLIETTLHGGGDDRTLKIGLARDARIDPRTPVVVTVDIVRLARLDLGGAGRIEGGAIKTAKLGVAIGGSGSIDLSALDAGELTVSIGGSGSFRADGRASKLAVNVAGSGRSDTERLAADDVQVAVAGSGDARVRAENALGVTIAGSGEVYHGGAAKPRVTIVGSGRVKPI